VTEHLRELTPDDVQQSHDLGLLAFGGERSTPAPTAARPGRVAYGVFEDDRLLAKASVLDYAQWWGGRPVPMGGIASVAVHPDARGRGLAARLMARLTAQMTEAGQGISVLFPTSPRIYRPAGWEVVGALTRTRFPTGDLRAATGSGAVRVRSAGHEDLAALRALWDEVAASGAGQLTRSGPASPRGLQDVLEADVVALAEDDGVAVGYAAYDRGRGYGPDSVLEVTELVATTPGGHAALLRSLATWDSVAGTVDWRGPTDELALHLGAPLPAPHRSQPWMLRVVDAPVALATRGWPAAVELDTAFALDDPAVPSHARPWRLRVSAGQGRLEPAAGGDLPRLHVRGLALLYAGSATTAALRRAGLLDGALPGLDAAFSGPPADLRDYF
jgi:predicted acetyltransferase